MGLVLKFLILIRWKNLVILVITQWFTYLFLSTTECFHLTFNWKLLIINFSTITVAGAGYLINDYFDLKIDAVNKPESIIIEKYISRRWVLFFHSFLNAAGVFAGFWVSKYFVIINILIGVLLLLYSSHFKKTFFAGNILIAFLMALSLPVVVFSGTILMKDWLIFYSFFAFLTGIIREIIKDLEDTEGDSRYNSHSLAIELGFYKTKNVIKSLTIAALILLTTAIFYLIIKEYNTLPTYLMVFVVIPLLIFLFNLTKLHSFKQFSKVSKLFKVIMVAGIFSMALRCLNISI